MEIQIKKNFTAHGRFADKAYGINIWNAFGVIWTLIFRWK